MPLQFLNKLNEAQIIDLINYINSNNEYAHNAKQVQIFAEPERCDEFGNQEIFVNAWDDNFYVGMYSIQDFNMMKVYPEKNNSSELREYMASIFGEEYLNALRNYFALEAEKEIERIKSTLGMGRS